MGLIIRFQKVLPMKTQKIRNANKKMKEKLLHTPNGYDPCWIEAINGTLEGRECPFRIIDISDELWDERIGPMIDSIEDRDFPDIITK